MKSKGGRSRDSVWLDNSEAEDVHHFAETELIKKLGPLGAKLHTGRSRNEMVATEFRMYVMAATREIRTALASLLRAVATQAKSNLGIPMPGTTHMQHAQPLLLSHWLLAHGEALQRDSERLRAAAVSADSCPLGSGALAGCAFPLIARPSRAIWASRVLRPTVSTPSATAILRSSFFSLSQLWLCTSHVFQRT